MYAGITEGKHRFEHWLVDSQVYVITACFPAFTSPEACAVFWDRFDYYTKQFGFDPWATSLMNNHYHSVGFPSQRREPERNDAAHPRLGRETGE
jgi:hypothetical protein